LTSRCDDDIVIAFNRRKESDVLVKTILAFQELVNYSRNEDGSWRAEFHGPIDIVASGPTLEACRRHVQDSLDAALEAWITGRKEFARREPDAAVGDGVKWSDARKSPSDAPRSGGVRRRSHAAGTRRTR
jgi:hypothetical protein